MTALQIIGFIGIGIILIGAIFFAKEWFKIGLILLIVGAMVGMIGAIGYHVERDKETPTALDGYIFKDENGNVINATKIVLEKKKKEYPKSYEECCEIVKVGKEHTLEGATIRINYKIALLESFQKLLICRDAYWKIAGNEMGLGEPWEPDYNDINHETPKYCIYCDSGIISKGIFYQYQFILAFPTEEMRDAFYENFKSEIESCKELL